MEDRVAPRGPTVALAALGFIGVVTAAWWMLALWPMPATTPSWLLRTREVCFGSPGDGLPSPGGWVLLIGEPLGMAATLWAIARAELAIGLKRAWAGIPGRLTLVAALAGIVIGLAATARRVAAANPPVEPADPRIATIDRPIPAFDLFDQRGARITPDQFADRPVIFAFAFGHCATVCPATIERVREAVAAVPTATGVVITVDPWREPPERLAALADRWRFGERIHLLSGPVDSVIAVLARFKVRALRDSASGEITHSSLAQVARDGRIRYLVSSLSPALVDAARKAATAR